MKLYELKISLRGISKPPVWRKVIVKAGCNLADLHLIIQVAMGWRNGHLYHFIAGTAAPIFIGPYEEDFFENPNLPVDDQSVVLEEYLKKPQDIILYEYDLGDNWLHEIKLEKIITSKEKHPVVSKAKGACPPEDCGGVWGYDELKKALVDPTIEEAEATLEWLEYCEYTPFDPQKHNLEEANQILATEFKYSRKKKATKTAKSDYPYDQTDRYEYMGEEAMIYQPKKGVLVNYSNVDLGNIGKKLKKAMPWDTVKDVEPTAITHFDGIDNYALFLQEECQRILAELPEAVHINIDNNVLAYDLTNFCLELGIHCFSSITQKEISLVYGKKKEIHHIVQFLPFIPF